MGASIRNAPCQGAFQPNLLRNAPWQGAFPEQGAFQAQWVHPLIKRVWFERLILGGSWLYFGSWLLPSVVPRGAVERKVSGRTSRILRNASLIYRFLARARFREPPGLHFGSR